MSSQFAQYWFTNNRKPHWRPRRGSDYNQLFLHQLAQLHEVYQLSQRKFGLSTSNYLRKVYARQHVAYVKLARLDWKGYTKHHPGHISLHFRLELELYLPASEVPDRIISANEPIKQGVEYVKVDALPFLIRFDSDYPNIKPDFDLDRGLLEKRGLVGRKYKNLMSSYLCVMNNVSDWVVGQNNNMVTAVDCMVDWMVDNYFNPWK